MTYIYQALIKSFTHILQFSQWPYEVLTTNGPYFIKGGNWAMEKLGNLLNVTQLVSGEEEDLKPGILAPKPGLLLS